MASGTAAAVPASSGAPHRSAGPADLPEAAAPRPASLPGAARRAFGRFRANQMTDAAAALTYYAMASLFPLLVAAISIFSLVGDPKTVTDFVEYLAEQGVDATTYEAIDQALTSLVTSSSGGASIALAVSLTFALNGASGAFAAAGRALNRVYAVEDDRSFVRRKLVDVGMVLVVIALLLVAVVGVSLGGGIVDDLFGRIGLGDSAATVWSIARWPLALLAAMTAYAVVYAFAPDIPDRPFRWLSPGAVCGVLIWLVASLLFALYLKTAGSQEAYGAFGAALVLLLWLWISSCAFLLGAELNAEVERTESAGIGGPPILTPPPVALPLEGRTELAGAAAAGSRAPRGSTGHVSPGT